MATHSSILPWRIPWIQSLAGYSPWGCKESDTNETLSFLLTLPPGEGRRGRDKQWDYMRVACAE